ncbi:hypothetical protein HDV06_005834 [Boothiomyces sp. JEL0866]|nr:hypothetical protein HDV06_005834 [Boothiomyces sp. JEL0866]
MQCTFANDDYDLHLHIVSIFIVMFASCIGTMVPSALESFLHSQLIITKLKLFGCGVIISTAYIHMFVPANQIFMNDCLPELGYDAFAGLFCLIGTLITFGFQLLATKPMDINNCSYGTIEPRKTSKLAAFILECGISFHSVLIGIALGTATEQFIPLLIAISIHQFFEGIALSAVFSEASFAKSKMVLMTVVYSSTAPIGILIGILLSMFVKEHSAQSLFIQGSFDALSAGILIFNGFCNILSPHFDNNYFKSDYWYVVGGCIVMAVIGIWI